MLLAMSEEGRNPTMGKRKEWKKPTLKTIKAGSAEIAKTGPNFDGGSPPSHKRS